MIGDVRMAALNRADYFVVGAEASFNAGALASCALCCYAAVFWAQIAVLERLGIRQPKWSHDGLRNKFSLEAIKKCKLFEPEVVDHIRKAYYVRHDAHYSTKELTYRAIERLMRHTRSFVEQVRQLLSK